MQRVLVIGSPGAGKSTLSHQLAERTGLPLHHLDRMHWLPGWIERDRDVINARAARMKHFARAISLAALALIAANPALSANAPLADADYRADALSFEGMVNQHYAYLDRFAGGQFHLTEGLRSQAQEVHDSSSLLAFLENAIALMADHHAITGGSHADSWGLAPSYADIWVVKDEAGYRVTDVKPGSPAAGQVQLADRVSAIGDEPVGDAVAKFWRALGVAAPGREQQEFGARVLLAGRRDRVRRFTLSRGGGAPLALELPNLYVTQQAAAERGLVTVKRTGRTVRIRMNNSLGESEAIAAFDVAMAKVGPGETVIVDLSDTGSGGNSTVARAMMSWFITRPRPYQMHSSPEEMRETGIARQWAEYVLPRAGKHHFGPVIVKVGRWTGSMGEGLAVGFDALGVPVCGSPMAGLLGAIEDVRLEHSGQVVKFATERLATVSGVPREQFRPRPLDDRACAADRAAT